MRIILRISRSQQMALIDILITYMRMPNEPQEFIDCSSQPAKTTTVGELLTLVSSWQEVELQVSTPTPAPAEPHNGLGGIGAIGEIK